MPPADAPVSFPMFAALAAGITGKSVYEVLELVGGLFEAAGAVFEGSPDAPATLIALLPPSDRAAMNAAQLALEAQATAPTLRLGIDATEVHSKQEQDARWQQVIDSAVRLQKAARTGEVIAGDTMEQLSNGGAVAEGLRVGDETSPPSQRPRPSLHLNPPPSSLNPPPSSLNPPPPLLHPNLRPLLPHPNPRQQLHRKRHRPSKRRRSPMCRQLRRPWSRSSPP
jgi:hypothetical protein